MRWEEEGRLEIGGAVAVVVALHGFEDGVAVALGVPAAGFEHPLPGRGHRVGMVDDALLGADAEHLAQGVARGQHHPPVGVGPGGDQPFGGDGIRMGIGPPAPVRVGGDAPVIQREDGLGIGQYIFQPGQRVLVPEQQQGVALEAEEILRVVFGGDHQLAVARKDAHRVGVRAEDIEAVPEDFRGGIGDGVVLVDGFQLAEVPEDVLPGGAGVLVLHLVFD